MGEPADSGAPDRVLWTPSAEQLEQAELTRYARWLERKRGLAFADYHELWAWSVHDLDAFWDSLFDYFEIPFDGRRGPALAEREMPGARWFPGRRVNYAERMFVGRDPATLAIVHSSELRGQTETSWGELAELTARVRAGLVDAGVGRGARDAALMPNVLETVAALLASASLGAIWSCVAPEMGAASVIDRLEQIEPKIVIAVDGYRYSGRDFQVLDTVAALRGALPSAQTTVLLPYLDPGRDVDALPGVTSWARFTARRAPLEFERVPFEQPLWVLYSSGTTGPPKAIVHSQGGILLEHLKKLRLHVDARAGDRFFWFTTTGWMMWNFQVGGLLSDAAIVLYDGSPRDPDGGALFDVAARSGATCFGASAGYIAACIADGVTPREGRDLSRLRALGSTGSPLPPEAFDWVYRELGEVWLFSTSGGTDVCTSFLGGAPTLPVHRGELQARSLGADVQAFDPDGEPLREAVGELVIAQPMPSMPICFWGDADGSRLRESYFDTYPGVWHHGDWVRFTRNGGAVILGRSDATINRGGVRMGSSEIYRVVLAIEEVLDALVVDVPRTGGGSWMPLFVVLRDGVELDEGLTQRIRARIRNDCSPRHVPDELHQIAQTPRTLSGKLLEVPVKRILMGDAPEAAAESSSLANPDSLRPFLELARLRLPEHAQLN
ncbi:MAG: acetoacetate--CoA ligase [Solirubrobacteraceae bacterium]